MDFNFVFPDLIMASNMLDFIYRSNTYVWSKDFKVFLALSIPTSRNEPGFILHQYLPVPINLDMNTSIMIKPEHQYIGIAPNLHSYRLYTKTEIDALTHVMGSLISTDSHGLTYFNQHPDCLSSLYFQQFNRITSLCQYYVINHIEESVQYFSRLQKGTYLLYTPRPATINHV